MNENVNVTQKSNKRKLIVVLILMILVILGLVGYICFEMGLFTKKVEPKNEENNTTEVEKTTYSDIYGFAYTFADDNEYKLMGLRSNGEDVELNKGSGRITFVIKNNKLLFTNTRANSNTATYTQKVYYIDLDDKSYTPVELASDIGIYDYFDFNDDYLFARNGLDDVKGIVKYDIKNKKRTIILEDVYANGFFIDSSKLYYYYTDYSDTPKDKYYTIDFDGNNNTEITKEEYDSIVSKTKYKEEVGDYNSEYFIKNGKKVYLDEELHNVYLDDKIIYTISEETRWIALEYSEDPNIIYFTEVTENNGPAKSYRYYIDTEKLEEINEEQIVMFKEILID